MLDLTMKSNGAVTNALQVDKSEELFTALTGKIVQ